MKSSLRNSKIGQTTRHLLRSALCGLISAFGLSTFAVAADSEVEMVIPPGDYAKQLGNKPIADPSGVNHDKAMVKGKVVVAVFTIPNMTQGKIQEKWAKILADDSDTKVSAKVFLVLVEDMSQAGWTKGMARSSMKKEFTPTARPFLVVDETGEFTKRFGVPANITEILIYDKKGKLRDVETDLAHEQTTDARVKSITTTLMAE